MSCLTFENLADATQQPFSRVTPEQSDHLVKPGRVGFAR